MNNQTPGPLRAIDGTPCQGCDSFLMVENGGALGHSPKPSESALGYTRYKKADASLLAAAYTSYDKAGRELGIDATKLAQSLDIAALIRALISCQERIGQLMGGRTFERDKAWNQAHDLLAKL